MFYTVYEIFKNLTFKIIIFIKIGNKDKRNKVRTINLF